MRKVIISLIIIVMVGVVVAGVYFLMPSPDNNESLLNKSAKIYQQPFDYPIYPIDELVQDWQNETLRSGRFNTTGFVARYFECPPCPAGAACIQCPGEGLAVSATEVEPTDLATPTVLIIAQDFEQFETGRFYEMSISIEAELRQIELVGILTDELIQ